MFGVPSSSNNTSLFAPKDDSKQTMFGGSLFGQILPATTTTVFGQPTSVPSSSSPFGTKIDDESSGCVGQPSGTTTNIFGIKNSDTPIFNRKSSERSLFEHKSSDVNIFGEKNKESNIFEHNSVTPNIFGQQSETSFNFGQNVPNVHVYDKKTELTSFKPVDVNLFSHKSVNNIVSTSGQFSTNAKPITVSTGEKVIFAPQTSMVTVFGQHNTDKKLFSQTSNSAVPKYVGGGDEEYSSECEPHLGLYDQNKKEPSVFSVKPEQPISSTNVFKTDISDIFGSVDSNQIDTPKGI